MGFFDWWFRKKPALPAIPIVIPLDIVLPPLDPAPSPACIQLIERTEGFRAIAYSDQTGYAIGYGSHTVGGKPVVAGQTITLLQADMECQSHAQACATAIVSMVKVPLTQGQLDALTDFVYNVGLGALQSSTLLRIINAKLPVTQNLFTVWNKITVDGQLQVLPALTLRRMNEYQLWLS